MTDKFAQLIKALRTSRRMSMRRLAPQANINWSTLSRWESGAQQPRLPELECVLKALGASAEHFKRALALIEAPRAVRALRQETDAEMAGYAPTHGDLLRAMRLRKGFTLEQLAGKLGMQHSTLSRWERMETWPSDEKIHAICYALGGHEKELIALTMRRFFQEAVVKSGSDLLDNLSRRLDWIQTKEQEYSSALMDLRFISLEAQMQPLAHRQSSLRELLFRTYAIHANSLSVYNRFAEAGEYAERALDTLSAAEREDREFKLRYMVSRFRFRAIFGVQGCAAIPEARARPPRKQAFLHHAAGLSSVGAELSGRI